jgi:MoaA/NifB/PqqE/SkfB family radical SAM enzyme
MRLGKAKGMKQETQLKKNKSADYKIKPEFCCFGVIDECFLRCKMCQKWKPDIHIKAAGSVPVSSWKNAIASLKTIVDDGFLINFGGGEPLLFDGLLDLIRYAADRGFRTNIATNGCLLNEDMAKLMSRSGLSSINLSLDSMDEFTHDYLRGTEGVYAKVMRAIEYIDRYCGKDLEIIVCSALYDINIEGAVKLAEWVNNHPRIKWVYFMAAMQPNNTRFDPKWYKGEFSYLWPRDTARAVSIIDTLIEMKNRGYKINNQVCQLEAFKKYFTFPDRFVKNAPCNLDRAVHVSAIGDIFICYDWQRLGNIQRDDLASAWYCSQADAVREDIRNCKKNCHHLINCFFEGDYPFEVDQS